MYSNTTLGMPDVDKTIHFQWMKQQKLLLSPDGKGTGYRCGKAEWSSVFVHGLQITLQWHFPEIYSSPSGSLHSCTHMSFCSNYTHPCRAQNTTERLPGRSVAWSDLYCTQQTVSSQSVVNLPWVFFCHWLLYSHVLRHQAALTGPKCSSKQLFLPHSCECCFGLELHC